MILDLPCPCSPDIHVHPHLGGAIQYRSHDRGCPRKAAVDLYNYLCRYREVVGNLYLYDRVLEKDYRKWYYKARRSDSRFNEHLVVTLRIGSIVEIIAPFHNEYPTELNEDALGELVALVYRKGVIGRGHDTLGSVTPKTMKNINKSGIYRRQVCERFTEMMKIEAERFVDCLSLMGYGRDAFSPPDYRDVLEQYHRKADNFIHDQWTKLIKVQEGNTETAKSSMNQLKSEWKQFKEREAQHRRDLLNLRSLPDVGMFVIPSESEESVTNLVELQEPEVIPRIFEAVASISHNIYTPVANAWANTLGKIPLLDRGVVLKYFDIIQELCEAEKHRNKAEIFFNKELDRLREDVEAELSIKEKSTMLSYWFPKDLCKDTQR
ncbi:MAG: hypothetical protein GY845_02595 [Planctomycetes bacterium]|nr:hypothetical protein [Planctomycetota bacterium]